MAKSQYRSEMEVMHEILSIVANGGRFGTNVSHISAKANISHYAAMEKCQKILRAELIEQHIDKRNRIFRITEKGFAFIKELDRFQNIVCSFNLKY
ncbi:MAG: winged helix-turn-helix domain-containing protein [Nitrosopumilus sp.]